MPYELKPHNGIGLSFTLKDGDDYELVGTGFRYRRSTFRIKDFLSYGYNDYSVVVKCTDSLGAVRYLVSYETGYRSRRGNPEISFKEVSSQVVLHNRGEYRWSDVDEERATDIVRVKVVCQLGAIVSLVVCTRTLLQVRRLRRKRIRLQAQEEP